jgi:hypothetical protein
MSPARKHRPGWDDASYIMRTDPERIAKPRLPATVIKLPAGRRLDPARAVQAWAGIGLRVDESRIRGHWAALRQWERRIKRKS